jgi:hypothetical protein
VYSIRLRKQLNPDDYVIDVSEARKQEALRLSSRAAIRALPMQLTWDQVAARRRVNRNSFYAGVQERRQFQNTFGSRNKTLKTYGPFASLSYSITNMITYSDTPFGYSVQTGPLSTALGNLEKEINRFATTVSTSTTTEKYTATPPPARKAADKAPAFSVKETDKAEVSQVKKEATPGTIPSKAPTKDIIPTTASTSPTHEENEKFPAITTPTPPVEAKADTACKSDIPIEDTLSAIAMLRQKLFFTAPPPSCSSSTKEKFETSSSSAQLPSKRKHVHGAELENSEHTTTTTLSKLEKQVQIATSSITRVNEFETTSPAANMDEESKNSAATNNQAPEIITIEDSTDEIFSTANDTFAPQDSNTTGIGPGFSITTATTVKKESSFLCHYHTFTNQLSCTAPTVKKERRRISSCSVEEVTHCLRSSSFDDSAAASVAHNTTDASIQNSCTSTCSSDFDPKRYSLSAILSL